MPSVALRSIKLLFITIIAASAMTAGTSIAGQPITFTLTSGRQFEAEVAPETNDQKLWLQFRGISSRLLRPVEWDRLAGAVSDGERLDASELKRLAAEHAASGASNDETEGSPQTQLSTNENQLTQAEQAMAAMRASAKVVSVQVDAHAGNWDADPEVDGIVVYVVPIDAQSQAVAVSGTVQIEAYSRRFLASQHASASHGRSVTRLGRWVRQVNSDDFTPGFATLRLPLGSEHPSFDPNLAPDVLVNVKLVVPGSGVFERSIDGVRVRPFSPTRDALQRQTGHRFLPAERTSRGRRGR